MFIILATVSAVLMTIAEIVIFKKDSKFKSGPKTWLKNLVLIDFISLGVAKYILKPPHFLITDGCTAKDYIIFFVASLVVGALVILISALSRKTLTFDEEKTKKGALAVKIISTVLFFIGCVLFFATIWTGDTFGKLTGDQIVVNMLSPAEGSDTSTYITVAEGPVFSTLLFTIIFAFIDFKKFSLIIKGKTYFSELAKRIFCLVLSIAVLVGGFCYGYNKCTLYKIYNGYCAESEVIDNLYVNPRDVKINFPKQKRNLIHIYLESLENSYFSKELGGFMDMNLMPELEKLSYQGVVFSNSDNFFGGPLEGTGTQWSCASMINQTTGLPMKMPAEINSYANETEFLPGAYTLTDLLSDAGYEQTVMFGADASFGGLKTYYTTHGGVKVFDYSYAKENGLIPEDYRVWWGYEDDKLYEFAKEEITRLYETGKPFNFTMETADTHMPNGYLSENAETPYDNQYANVIAYSTSQACEFIDWIMDQPFYENTTIVIIGDHISMETNFFKHYNFTDDYLRTQYNCIINPAPTIANNPMEEVSTNRKWCNWDYFPTILAAMGCRIEGDRLGVGTNLFSNRQTVFEEYGVDYINKEFEKGSKLYNNQIFRNVE